jgi:hypothetical protein
MRWIARVALAALVGGTLGLCIAATYRNLPVIAVEAGILAGGALAALRLGPGANAGRHARRRGAGAPRHVAPRLWAQGREQARERAEARQEGPDE